jgi:hypothetical protein
MSGRLTQASGSGGWRNCSSSHLVPRLRSLQHQRDVVGFDAGSAHVAPGVAPDHHGPILHEAEYGEEPSHTRQIARDDVMWSKRVGMEYLAGSRGRPGG